MKRKLTLVLFCSMVLIALTGCGKSDKPKEYSDSIKERRESTILLLGEDNTLGKYLDYCLTDSKWTEDDSYQGERGNGAVIVKGKDRKTEEPVEILWVKEVTQGGAITPLEYLKIGEEEFGYSDFLSYLLDYQEEMEEYYKNNETEE